MSETNDTELSELENDLNLDTDQGEPSTLTDTDSDQSGEQQKVADLSFLDGKDKSKQEVVDKELERQKALEGQIKSAQKQVNSGEKTVDDFPNYIKSNLKTGESSKPSEIDEEAIIQKAVERVKNEQTFNALKDQIKQMDLTSDQAKNLQVEYEIMVKDGLTKTKALATAIRLAGLSSKVQEAEQRGIDMGKMSMVPQGLMPVMKKTQREDPLQMSDEDFMKWSNEQASKQSRFTRISN